MPNSKIQLRGQRYDKMDMEIKGLHVKSELQEAFAIPANAKPHTRTLFEFGVDYIITTGIG